MAAKEKLAKYPITSTQFILAVWRLMVESCFVIDTHRHRKEDLRILAFHLYYLDALALDLHPMLEAQEATRIAQEQAAARGEKRKKRGGMHRELHTLGGDDDTQLYEKRTRSGFPTEIFSAGCSVRVT